jgi:hypothetical protein
MRAQLRWIVETGEAQAYLVQDAESQTLMGDLNHSDLIVCEP